MIGGRCGNPEPNLGIIAAAGACWRLVELVGEPVANEILLAGRVIPDTPDTGFIYLTGAQLGWFGQGTFTAELDFPDMNGEIVPGLWLFDLGSTLEPPAWAGQFTEGSRWTLTIEDLPVPCRPDVNNDGVLNSQDFFDFLTQFFEGAIDYNTDDAVNSQDFFDFLSDFFQGCGV